MKFNVNDYVRFKMTPYGKRIYQASIEGLGLDFKNYDKPEEDGSYVMQMWTVMEIFGSYMFLGGDMPIETEMELVKK